jgi:PAS domain S-box-containing protein
VKRMNKRHLSFIPIPALIIIMAVLYLVVKPSLFFEPAWLLPITNTLFVTVVMFIVAYIAMRNYKATGRVQILLLGCGVLAFGIGGVVAGFLRSVPGAGANLNVTIYNTGALMGAIFHFIAALILLVGIFPEVGSKRKESWLVFSYVGLAIFMALFTVASLRGMVPPFFIQGVGPTILRQVVLGAADILFAFSFLIFMGLYLRNKEVFLYWYSSALALTAISLTAFFIQSAVGSPIGWTGRFSQYLGGIYFLIAVITTIRSAQARRTSFDNVLTASLSPSEEKFRALAENSPDIIDRFDKEIRHIYVNRAGLQFYGKPAGTIIGKTIEETGLPEPYCSLLKERIQKVFEAGQPMKVEEYVPAGKDTRFYQSHCVPEYGADGAVANVLVVSRDLTEHDLREQRIVRLTKLYAVLSRVNETIVRTHDEESLYKEVCRIIAEEGEFPLVWVGQVKERQVAPVASHGPATDYLKEIRVEIDGELGNGPTGTCIREDCSVVNEDFDTNPSTTPWRKPALRYRFRASAAFPVHREGRVVSALTLYSPEPGVFDTEQVNLLEALCADISYALDAMQQEKLRTEAENALRQRTLELQQLTERLEQRVQERTEELAEANKALRQLSIRLLSAHEEERKRIAGELHDTIGAYLGGIKFKVESALQQIAMTPRVATESLNTIIPVIREAVEECRRIQMDLRPSMLDDLGVLPTLSWFCRRFQTIYSGIRVDQEVTIEESEVPVSLKIVIYRVTQEAMNNSAKHSKPNIVRLCLRKIDGRMELVVEDNGLGFNVEEVLGPRSTRRGLGLKSMRERVDLSGGSFSIESSEGKGTIVLASWPLPKE